VFRLQFNRTQALVHAEKAYRYRPENTRYAHVYAYLLQEQNQHAQAIAIYEQNLQRLRDKGDKADVAGTLNNLGMLYADTQRFEEGEDSYKEALTIRRDLAKANPQAYLPDVAMTLNNFCTLYSDMQQFKEGETSCKEALTIYRDLSKTNPQTYLPSVAMTLNNLGLLYSNTQRFKKGETSYKEALIIYQDLAKANLQTYLQYVATTLNNLGVLYKDTQRFKEGETSYKEALTTYRDLAKANPQAYLPYVATTLNNLGVLYHKTQRFKEEEASYQESLAIFRDLAKANPQAYLSDVATTLNTLYGHVDIDSRLILTIYGKLAKANPQIYRYDLDDTLLKIVALYFQQGRRGYVATPLNTLGSRRDTQRFKEEEASYQKALTIFRDLDKTNPQVYRKDLADTLGKMALLYFEQDKKVEARRYFDESIPIYRELWRAYSELYAEQFWASLLLNVLTSPSEQTETHCALLKEAWQVAPSEKYKTAVLDVKERGGHCKFFPAPEK